MTAPLSTAQADAATTSPAKGQQLKTAGSPSIATPQYPMSGTTPIGAGADVSEGDVDMGQASQVPVKKDGEALATDLKDLQVKSPVKTNGELPSISSISQAPSGTDATSSQAQQTPTNAVVNSSIFGSNFDVDGYPRTTTPSETEDLSSNLTMDPYFSAQAAAAVAAADEAIKQLNGTATVRQGLNPLGQTPSGADDPYGLAPGFANFADPQARATRPIIDPHASRQSSTSSSTTEASTSSEESDLCIPSIEWVNLPNQPGSFQFTPYTPNAVPQQRMPPSATKAEAALAGGSALPSDMAVDQPAEDDDDEQTVGQGRRRSSSSSGNSINSASRPGNDDAGPSDSKGKRKAGSGKKDSANWRDKKGTGAAVGAGNGKATASSSRKRRRSDGAGEASAIDPSLLDEMDNKGSFAYPNDRYDESGQLINPQFPDSNELNLGGNGEEGTEHVPGYGAGGASGSESEDAGAASGSGEDYSASDSDYGEPSMRKKMGVSRSGRKVGMVKSRASVGGGGSSKRAAGGAGGAAKKSRKSDPGARKGSTGGGVGASAGGGGVGVQCEYINPLPPYNRCQDAFTRKYDLPRHMARHARREGELVYDGKLAEDKALLWKTIKDKPKVSCGTCGESFTRADALKRHQTKQNHQ